MGPFWLPQVLSLHLHYSAQYYVSINEFRRGVPWQRERKHYVFGSCN